MIRARRSFLIALAILSLVFIPPVAAFEEMEFLGVTNFNAAAPEDLHIVEITAGNIHNAANNTFYLNSYGQQYQLDVNMVSVNNVWWEADLSLEYPDGHVEEEHLSQVAVAWDYDICIQFSEPSVDSIIDLDLYIGLMPLKAQWNAIPPNSQLDYIPFSQASGTSTQPMDVKIYFLSDQELTNVREGNVWATLFSWSWDTILDFIEMVPYVGPYFAALLELTAMALDEIVWFICFLLVENLEITILLVEFFIIAHAMLTTKSLIALLKRILDDHIAVFNFTVRCILYIRDLIMWVIESITRILEAIKPI